MRQLPLALTFILAAGVSAVNVNAFKAAEVSNPTSLTVVSTTSAALALSPGTGAGQAQASVSGRMLQVDFRKGYNFPNTNYSLQRNRTGGGMTLIGDVFRMRDVFRVTNNSDDCQNVSVYVTSGGQTHLLGIYGRGDPTALVNGTQFAGVSGARIAANSFKLGTTSGADTVAIDFWWQATTTAVNTSNTFTIQVSATVSPTCP